MLRPNILCSLTPDAVALLDIIQSKSIAFRKLVDLRDDQEIADVAVQTTKRAKATRGPAKRAKAKRGTGKRTVNGVVFKSYRGQEHMAKDAMLAMGGKALNAKRRTGKTGADLAAINMAMTEQTLPSGQAVTCIRRDKAVALIQKNRPELKGYAASAVVSMLYKLGALRIVL